MSLERVGGVVAEGDAGLPFVNKWGATLLLASVGFVVAVLALWSVAKWRRLRRGWDRLPAGSLRLQAARNSLGSLELLSLLPVSDVGPRSGHLPPPPLPPAARTPLLACACGPPSTPPR